MQQNKIATPDSKLFLESAFDFKTENTQQGDRALAAESNQVIWGGVLPYNKHLYQLIMQSAVF